MCNVYVFIFQDIYIGDLTGAALTVTMHNMCELNNDLPQSSSHHMMSSTPTFFLTDFSAQII